MKLKFYLIRVVIVAFVFTCMQACTTTLKTSSTSVDFDYIHQTGIMTQPMVAEVEVEARRIGAEVVIKDRHYMGQDPVALAKKLAIAEAIKTGNADLIVHPMFDVTRKKGKTTVTVSGFAGMYKTFREFKLEDTVAFYAFKKTPSTETVVHVTIESANTVQPKSANNSNNKTKQANKASSGVLGVLLGILLLGVTAASL